MDHLRDLDVVNGLMPRPRGLSPRQPHLRTRRSGKDGSTPGPDQVGNGNNMRHHPAEYAEVIATEPKQLYEMLEAAEAALRQTATARGAAGILVIRHDLHRYTLVLDEAVPFGETREQSLL